MTGAEKGLEGPRASSDLRGLGLGGRDAGGYLASPDTLVSWSPGEAWQAGPLSARETLALLPEMLAASAVVVSRVSKVAALELARQRPAHLDQELRARGLGTAASQPWCRSAPAGCWRPRRCPAVDRQPSQSSSMEAPIP